MKTLYSLNRYFITVPVYFFLALLLTTCVKEEIDMKKISNRVDWNPKLGIPLAYGDLSLKDIIEAVDSGGLIREYPDSLFYITYSSHIFSKTIDSIFAIPNQQYQDLLHGSDLPGFIGDSLTYQRDSSYTFHFDRGEVVDSAFFKDGIFAFSVRSEFHHTGRITFTMPTLTRNGVPLSFTMRINRADGTFNDSILSNLNGYKIVLSPGNRLPFHYVFALGNSGQPILAAQSMTVKGGIRETALQSLYGYVGDYPIMDDISDKIKIDFFDNNFTSDVQFANPKLKLILSNSLGVPVSLQLTDTRTFNSDHGYVDLNLDASVIPHIIPYPKLELNQVGISVHTTLTIDNTNSNIVNAVNIAPQLLYYTVSATTNPDGKTVKNFALDTSRLNLDMEIELPMELRASNYELSDTMDFDLSGIFADYSVVNKLAINASFTNYIPFDLGVQLFLTDENYHIVDTLFTQDQQPIIESGQLSNGKVTSPKNKLTQVIYNSNDAKRLENVKYAILKGNISTAGTGYVKFYSYYKLNVALGVQVDLQITSLDQL
jgi:hypothetical protein